jgi:hypothetical protein
MKKLFSLLATLVLLMGFVFADEAVLFDYSAKADVLETGYDWVSNAKAVGVSGTYEPGRNLYNPVLSEKYGLCIRTDSAPQYSDSRYAIEFIEPSFNEPNSGTGYIKNAAAVKSMDITLTLNRGYDEVEIFWEQNGTLHKRKFKASDATTTIESMIEFNAHLDFSEYINDVRNRSTAQIPVAGLKMTDIKLKRIEVITHQAPGDWMYSPTSIVGIKKISMIYDKAVTDDAYERGLEADEVFGIKAKTELENKTRRNIEIYLRQSEYNKSLMATEGTQSESTDAK